jgi:rod shape-determining protein MreC
VLLTGIAVVILVVSGGVVSGIRTAAGLVVEPFSWSINAIARPIGHVLAGAINYSDVVHQNQELRAELGRARLQSEQTEALRRQVGELTSITNVPFVGTLPMVTAPISNASPTNFVSTIDIARGRSDGVLPGMPVVANGGLIGRVVSSTLHGATVALITDPVSLIGCTFGDGSSNVVITGQGVDAPLHATQVSLTAALSPGTIFSTDGLNGGLYPAGIPVARTVSTSITPGSTTYEVSLTPTADLRHIYYVDVLIWEPGT